MNRTKTAIAVVIALVGLVCAGLVFARWGQGPVAMDNPAGQQTRLRPFDRFIDRLGLTDDQAEELRAIFEEHRQSMRELRASLRDVLRAIREELAKDEPDEELLAQLIAQAKAIRDQMQAERDRFRAELDEFTADLSVKQQAMFFLMFHWMHHRMNGRPMMEGYGPSKTDKLGSPAPCFH